MSALAALSHASAAVELRFSDKGERLVFENAVWPVKDPANLAKVAGDTVSYRTTSDRNEDRIFVIDVKSGSVASKTIGEVRNGVWTIAPSDFMVAYKVNVEVSNASGPISAASVELQDALSKRTVLVDSTTKGVATFFFVKTGDVKVTVNYNADGKNQEPVRQTFTLDQKRTDAAPTFKVLVAGGSSSNQPASNTPATPGETPATNTNAPVTPPGGGNGPVGNILTTLLGLGIVAGVAYAIIRYMKQNDATVKDVLTKLGADVPQPPSNDPDPVAPTPIQPQPMQQIILDSSAPPDVMAAAPITPPAVVTGFPKLKSSDGSAFDLPDGEIVVGREFGVELVVPNETVSRKHASLIKTGTDVQIVDHGSTNGTWVNGMKVVGSQTLRPGDSIRFGSVEYRFEG
ncbi:MAG TPA: FHA domain-containing protein [Fimbriimonas sp.]|nr:FHA domain-containing protein [Fimbriimonas sp.]